MPADLIQKDDAAFLSSVLSPQEQEIVRELLTTTKSAIEVIPDDITPTDLWAYLSASCKGIARVDFAKSRLKLFLGRMLVQIQKYPELFQAQGYATFNAFATEGVEKLFGVSRNEAYVVKRIEEELGARLSIQEMSEIGISNLNLASKAIRQKIDEGTPPEIREKVINYWIESAKTDSVAAMNERLASNGLDPGEMMALTINVKKPTRDKYLEFRKQDHVVWKCGGNSDNSILDSLMDEASCWEAEYAENAGSKVDMTGSGD